MRPWNEIMRSLPPPAQLLDLEIEDLSGIVLEILVDQYPPYNDLRFKEFTDRFNAYAGAEEQRLRIAFAEAWAWLRSEAFLAEIENPFGTSHYFVTRRGRRVGTRAELEAYRRADLLPRMTLDPILQRDAKPQFDRGQYELAVFAAFKEVEVRVRERTGLPAELIGTKLMRRAFDSQSGPLRDPGAETSEADSLAHLMAGAIGFVKNPASHRRVRFDDPGQVAKLILFADLLLKIIDSRPAAQTQPPPSPGP